MQPARGHGSSSSPLAARVSHTAQDAELSTVAARTPGSLVDSVAMADLSSAAAAVGVGVGWRVGSPDFLFPFCFGLIRLCHYNFPRLEIYHYNSTIWNRAITIQGYTVPDHFVRLAPPWTHLQATVFAYCPHCPWPTRIQARLGLLPSAAPIRASLSPPGSPPRTLDPQPPAVRTTVVAGDPALLRRRRASRSARRGARLLGSWNPRFLGTQ